MNKNYSLLTKCSSVGSRWTAFPLLAVLGLFLLVPVDAALAGAAPVAIPTGGSVAAGKFEALRGQMQGFAVVVLLIMLVIAAIMAAMQKVGMAINVAIAAIILFGGGYIMLLIYSGLQ